MGIAVGGSHQLSCLPVNTVTYKYNYPSKYTHWYHSGPDVLSVTNHFSNYIYDLFHIWQFIPGAVDMTQEP